MFTMRSIVEYLVGLTKRINLSRFIPQRKIAAVTPDHWSPTGENETCGIKTLDSARLKGLDSASV